MEPQEDTSARIWKELEDGFYKAKHFFVIGRHLWVWDPVSPLPCFRVVRHNNWDFLQAAVKLAKDEGKFVNGFDREAIRRLAVDKGWDNLGALTEEVLNDVCSS
jgi:hypothetical protein